MNALLWVGKKRTAIWLSILLVVSQPKQTGKNNCFPWPRLSAPEKLVRDSWESFSYPIAWQPADSLYPAVQQTWCLLTTSYTPPPSRFLPLGFLSEPPCTIGSVPSLSEHPAYRWLSLRSVRLHRARRPRDKQTGVFPGATHSGNPMDQVWYAPIFPFLTSILLLVVQRTIDVLIISTVLNTTHPIPPNS